MHSTTRSYPTSRTRELAQMNHYLRGHRVEDIIADRIRQHGDEVDVLEFGTGVGHVLLELRRLFPSIGLTGLNKRPSELLAGSEDLRRVADDFGLLDELRDEDLPKIVFRDAREGQLDLFSDACFDVVISQFAVRYIKRKDVLLNEIWRILKPGGIALLQIGFMHVLDETGQPAGDELIARLQGEGIAIDGSIGSVLRLEKNVTRPLRVPLIFQPQDSVAIPEKGYESYFSLLEH